MKWVAMWLIYNSSRGNPGPVQPLPLWLAIILYGALALLGVACVGFIVIEVMNGLDERRHP